MPQNQDLEERTEDPTNLAGRHLTLLERRGATPTAQTNQENPKGFYNGLKRGAAGLLVGIGLMGLVGCATTGSYAQTQQQKPAQQYEEIDYEKTNLLYSNRVVGKPDFYNDEAVFSVIIPPIPPANMEIFISNRDGTNQKRLTDTPDDSESCPFETKDGKNIVFRSINLKKKTNKDYIMNKDGTDKREITEAVYSALAQERGKDPVKDFW